VSRAGGSEKRGHLVRPSLISTTLLLAVLAGGGIASAEGPRWTPLTGLLAPSGSPDAAPSVPTETSSTEAPTAPKATVIVSDAGPAAPLTLTVKLGRVPTDGPPQASLDVKVVTVDADLAGVLDLGAVRGALVTEAGAAAAGGAGLIAGDIIVAVDGRAVTGSDALGESLRGLAPGRETGVTVRRVGAGARDLERLLIERAGEGNVGASASLGRFYAQGIVFGEKAPGKAASYALQAAEGGHLASMTRYALFAKDGIGIPKDETLAARWFRKAADGGQDVAMTNLGTLYEGGLGVTQDDAEAARWYRAAVDKGHVFAMHRLALLYEAGRGVKKDDGEAVRLLQAASDKGLSEATSWLADKYEQGRGVPKNEEEAFRLNARVAAEVRRAADLGNAVATFNLGILYRAGKGVTKSDTEAASWIVKSLKLGDTYLVSELMRNPTVLSEADRKWVQEVLRDAGAYTGPIDGAFTPEVRTAMEQLGRKV